MKPLALPLLAPVLALALAASPLASGQTLPPANPAAPSDNNVRLPSLGDAGAEDFTVGTERRIGDQVMREIRTDPAYIDDPQLLEYVQSLWSPLVAASRQRGNIGPDIDGLFAWEVFLVRDRSVNAFALPGGYVGIHLGLIAITASGDELASVMAHELSHVTQRHIARSIASSGRQSMLGLAAMLLGLVAAGRAGSADMASAAIIGGQAAMVQGQLNFSRDVEREADRVGSAVLGTAGYSPTGMVSMFEKMDNASRLNDSGAYPYLRSHPLTTERIADARARAGSAPPPRPSAEHAMMQARSKVLMDTGVQALRRVQAQEQGASPNDRLAALYASAMASDLLREPARAQATLATAGTLLASMPDKDPRAARTLLLMRAQAFIDAGTPAQALALLEAQPDASRAALLMRAQAALDLARNAGGPPTELKRATDALQTWVTDKRQDSLAWSLLAQCADQLGFKLRAVRAEAESRAAVGDINGAIDRLRAGQRLARSGGSGVTPDFVEASVIDARTRDLMRERRQLWIEAHNGREPPPDF